MPEYSESFASYGRPFWTGTVSFGLVNVPVGLFPASRATPLALRMVSEEGTPLQRRYYAPEPSTEPISTPSSTPSARGASKSAKRGAAAPARGYPDEPSRSGELRGGSSDIVRAYEIEKGKFVVVEDHELARLAPEKSGNIDLTAFVKAREIDPMYFERGYYLMPTGTNTKAYRLLAKVMEDEGLAGIATFVMRAREYLIAITADQGILRAETMRFADEVRTPEFIGLPQPERVSADEVARVGEAIAKLSAKKFDEKDLVDHSAVRLLDIVESKLEKGEHVVETHEQQGPPEGERRSVIELMEALQRSLKTGKPEASGKAGAKPGRTGSKRKRSRRAST